VHAQDFNQMAGAAGKHRRIGTNFDGAMMEREIDLATPAIGTVSGKSLVFSHCNQSKFTFPPSATILPPTLNSQHNRPPIILYRHQFHFQAPGSWDFQPFAGDRPVSPPQNSVR